MAPAPPNFSNAFQVAYVTRDLERAIDQFTARNPGIEFVRVATEALEFKIPKAPASMKTVVGWVGDLMVEIIQPLSGAVDIYVNALPEAEDAMAFHHLGMRVEGDRADWDAFRAALPLDRVAIEGGREEIGYVYIDERATLGHYMEYVWMSDGFCAANPIWTMR